SHSHHPEGEDIIVGELPPAAPGAWFGLAGVCPEAKPIQHGQRCILVTPTTANEGIVCFEIFCCCSCTRLAATAAAAAAATSA
ncbi:unnamed protein product, partial [Ectocarpus sp. 12 AP-2014]